MTVAALTTANTVASDPTIQRNQFLWDQPIQLLSSKTEELLLFLQPTQIEALDPDLIFK